MPRHDVVQAALHADPGRVNAVERERRSLLGLPPFAAYGEISGSGSDEFVASIPPTEGLVIVGGDGAYACRAPDWMVLGRAISAGTRPPGARLRIAIDPPR